jgi:SAM-dependent methyltransferase
MGFTDVVGVEPSDAVAARARARGLDVRTSSVEAADLPEGAFDVVTCFDALEHMTDPVAALRRMARWIAPGGICAVTVPDFGGWWARLSGRHWPFVTPWEHLHYFGRRSLRTTLRAAGLVPASVERAGTAVSWGTLVSMVDARWDTELEGLLSDRAARGFALPFGTLLALSRPARVPGGERVHLAAHG